MKKIIINGNKPLKGTIKISGAKNAAVALVPAAIMTDDVVELTNVPNISDIESLDEILTFLDVETYRKEDKMVINPRYMNNKAIPEIIANKLRASYYFMGALLAKYKKVEISFPGGCNIGKRPIDLHLEGFKKLGSTIIEEGNKYILTAEDLKGADINLDIASVGATINIMLAATKAKGITKIKNAAREPEIINVATFLNNMGAKITGAGTSEITIEGVETLTKGQIEVIPDRIEAGTYVIAGALLGEDLRIENLIPEHIEALTKKLTSAGANIDINKDYIICNKANKLIATNIETYYFPGFATDLQQPFMTFLTQCEGESIVEEKIYENRFMQVEYLNKMGANIKVDKRIAKVEGKTKLIGKEVEATDLRAGASLVIAGLIAENETIIDNVEHILRGYEGIIEKLQSVGADIIIKED